MEFELFPSDLLVRDLNAVRPRRSETMSAMAKRELIDFAVERIETIRSGA